MLHLPEGSDPPGSAATTPPLVSVIIPCRNEAANIGAAIESVLAQTYRPVEIVVADGQSDDDTMEVVEALADSSSVPIRIIDNPDRTIPSGLNMAVGVAKGSLVVRLDAHASMTPGYIETCVDRLSTGQWSGVGGRKRAVSTTRFGRAAAIAFGSRVGAGDSYYHYGTEVREVEHVPFGAYPKYLIDGLGGWDEALLVNQDFEFDQRVQRGGGRILFDPDIEASWHGRESLRALAYQYFRYGRGKAVMLRRARAKPRWRQLAPPALVAGLLAFLIVGAAMGSALVALGPTVAYLLACLGIGSAVALRASSPGLHTPLVGAAIATMHLLWGTGFLVGRLARSSAVKDPFLSNPSSVSRPNQAVSAQANDDLSVGRRAGALVVALVDQASQSLVNLLLSIAVATTMSAGDFGRFSLILVVFTVVWGCGRALLVEPFMAQYGGKAPQVPIGLGGYLTAQLLKRFALPVSLIALAASFVFDGVVGLALLLFAVLAPAVFALDAVRAVNIAARRVTHTIASSATRVVGFAAVLVAGLVWSIDGLSTAVLGLTAATIAAAIVGAVGIGSWSTGDRSTANTEPGAGTSAAVSTAAAPALDMGRLLGQGRPLLLEFLLVGLTIHSLNFVVAAVAGFEEAGGFRGAIVIAGPIVTLISGLRLGVVVDATRYREVHGDSQWAPYLLRVTAVFGGVSAIIAVVLIVAASQVGERLLGPTWEFTRDAVPYFTSAVVVTSIHLVTGSILRVRNMAAVALRTRAVQLPLAIVPSVVGAMLAGASGAAAGYLIGVIAVCPLWIKAALGPATGSARVGTDLGMAAHRMGSDAVSGS